MSRVAAAGALAFAAACGSLAFPAVHRPVAIACNPNRPPQRPGPSPTAAPALEVDCRSDEDCKAGRNGRCSGGGHTVPHCSYDACARDEDCGAQKACACDPSEGNACVPANCRTDADCGGRGCSPTAAEMCGNMGGVAGFYCRTEDDECVSNEDCTSDGSGLCVYDANAAHWKCNYMTCMG